MKIAILGGSFNPVHIGHLLLADAVLNRLSYDRIILIPAFISPFKPGAGEGSAQDRLDMLAASIPADPRLTLDDGEIRRGGVSYTIDTIDDIEARYRPEGKLGLILGDDLARGFPEWRRAADIVQRTNIIIARRLSAAPVSFPYSYTALDNTMLYLSSGLVRGLIQHGGDWRYLVPPGARLIIESRRLYGHSPEGESPAAPSWPLIAQVETTARAMLNPGRFLHSRNVALWSWDLCCRFGLEPAAGYLAGIAHDICKSLSAEEQRRLTEHVRLNREDAGKREGALLHAEAGAVFLQERFKVTNKEILNAIRYHTTGALEMGPLAKAVYIADKIEPSRREVRPELREFGRYQDLDAFFDAVLEETVAHLHTKKVDISPGTRRLLDAAQKKRRL